MQIDDIEYEVTAMVACNDEALHLAINDAYQARYGEGEASMIAGAMQARSRWPMTMEFKISSR
ncbi:hypothetical protein JCM19233_5613 [Vibrio astriarenae]|nr:hypothetical protein JCM19233_5613 [Vibrio sp. C7]